MVESVFVRDAVPIFLQARSILAEKFRKMLLNPFVALCSRTSQVHRTLFCSTPMHRPEHQAREATPIGWIRGSGGSGELDHLFPCMAYRKLNLMLPGVPDVRLSLAVEVYVAKSYCIYG